MRLLSGGAITTFIATALADISPLEVEDVVGRILSQYYNCDVRHVGRSHDEGIDLIVIASDQPVAIQVKHRSRARKTAGVETIREFVGALVGSKFKKGVVVSTAERFTNEASSYASRATRNYCPINLVDLEHLRSMIAMISRDQQEEYVTRWAVAMKVVMDPRSTASR